MNPRPALLLILALVLLALAACGGSPAPEPNILSFDAPCPDPAIETPYTEPFHPGGASFDVLADTPGTYLVRCGPQIVDAKVVPGEATDGWTLTQAEWDAYLDTVPISKAGP